MVNIFKKRFIYFWCYVRLFLFEGLFLFEEFQHFDFAQFDKFQIRLVAPRPTLYCIQTFLTIVDFVVITFTI